MNKTLLAVLALATCATAALAGDLPCSLSENDYAALARAKNHYTRDAVESLPDVDKQNLCKARKLVQRVMSTPEGQRDGLIDQLKTDDIPVAMSRFVPPDEYKDVGPIAGKVIARAALQKGVLRVGQTSR